MTRLAVVAYPRLSDDDRRWLESLRARYDPLASRIAAHFTLVFPTDVAAAPVVAAVRQALRSPAPIAFVLRRAAACPDVTGAGHYVALLAEEGHRDLIALHDRLHGGALAAHRRPDIPFVPHVTVGARPGLDECERIADRLNQEHRTLRGRITGLDVIDLEETMARTVVDIPFGSAG